MPFHYCRVNVNGYLLMFSTRKHLFSKSQSIKIYCIKLFACTVALVQNWMRKIFLKNMVSNLLKRQLRILFSAIKDYRLKYLLLCNPLLSFFGKVAIFFQKQNCNKKYLLLKMPLFVHFYWTKQLRNLRTKIQFILVVVVPYFFLAYPHQKRNFFGQNQPQKLLLLTINFQLLLYKAVKKCIFALW